MRLLRKIGLLVASLLAAVSVSAATYGNTNTYAGLTWSFSTSVSGLSGCNYMILDATGDFAQSDNYSIYGTLDCPTLGGSYNASGNAYFGGNGGFNISMLVGVVYQIVCTNLNGSTLSGSCPVYNNSGTLMGTAFVTFL